MSALSDIRTAARRLLSETNPNNSHFADAALNALANEWLRDLAVKIEWPRAEATDTSVQNQPTYSLPSDFLSMIMVLFDKDGNGEDEVEYCRFEDLPAVFGSDWKDAAAGTPERYYFSDTNVLGLQPKPNAANATKTIRIFYVIVPAAMSADTDEPDVPAVFHDTAAYFIAARAHASVQNMAMHDNLMKFYEDDVKLKKGKVGRMTQAATAWQWAETEES